MFIELHMLHDNRKLMLNINNIQCIGQLDGITYIDFGNDIFQVKESYEQIRQMMNKIDIVENVESEDNGIMDNVVGLYRGHGNVIEIPKKATNKELLKWLFPQYEIILEEGDTYTILLQPYHALSPKIIVFKSWLEESYND